MFCRFSLMIVLSKSVCKLTWPAASPHRFMLYCSHSTLSDHTAPVHAAFRIDSAPEIQILEKYLPVKTLSLLLFGCEAESLVVDLLDGICQLFVNAGEY